MVSCIVHRYDMALNRWLKETTIPEIRPCKKPLGFIVLDGELHVMTLLKGSDLNETRRSQQHNKRAGNLFIQIYHPRKKTWRYLFTKPPFPQPLDFGTAIMCTVGLQSSSLMFQLCFTVASQWSIHIICIHSVQGCVLSVYTTGSLGLADQLAGVQIRLKRKDTGMSLLKSHGYSVKTVS